MITTAINTKFDEPQPVLDGSEQWPVIGNALSEQQLASINFQMVGLTRHWNCETKVKIVLDVIGSGFVVIGSMYVLSPNNYGEYGFEFNPPFEFHAWVQLLNNDIVDVALPGVIEKGLNTSDHIGPMIINREPAILAGRPPDWLQYKPIAVYKIKF